jgi:hypothetical protein
MKLRRTLIEQSVAKQAIEERTKKLERIVGHGLSGAVYEEVLLVLTLRVQIDTMCTLGQRVFGPPFANEKLAFDSKLRKELESPSLRGVVKQARSAFKRNWGLPSMSQWVA